MGFTCTENTTLRDVQKGVKRRKTAIAAQAQKRILKLPVQANISNFARIFF